MGRPNSRPRHLSADHRHATGRPNTRQTKPTKPTLRILAGPEQDPRTSHRRHCWQWYSCRQTRQKRDSVAQIESADVREAPARIRSQIADFRIRDTLHDNAASRQYRSGWNTVTAPERLAQSLLSFGCWEFQSPSSKQAPPGQHISSPAAYFFGTVSRQSTRWSRSG